MRFLAKIILLITATSLLLSSCSFEKSPEDQVRAYIAAGEEAAEARDIGALKELISEKYADDHKRTRQDIIAISYRYFLANKNIHIFSRIAKLEFPESDKAQLQLFVAMTGQDVSDLDSLLNMQADLYRFDLQLVLDNDDWKLISAEWQPAGPEDFF